MKFAINSNVNHPSAFNCLSVFIFVLDKIVITLDPFTSKGSALPDPALEP